MKLMWKMNIRILFLTIIFLSSNKLLSQSFENDLELKNNILSYPFNENNGFLNKDQSKLFFNSSNNPNNTLGINDMNDIWFRNKIDGFWGLPVNLNEINTKENDLLLGVDDRYIYVLRSNNVVSYSLDEPYKMMKEESIRGFENNFEIISGSINPKNNIIFLSIESFGSFGVEDIYYSTKSGDGWGRLSNIGSTINSSFQEISPFLLNDDTLIFVSNRSDDGYNLYYSTKNGEEFKTWNDPIKLDLFNSMNSEVSLSYNQNSKSFLLSSSSDSRTNSDLFEYITVNYQNNYELSFNLNSGQNKGIIEVIKNNSLVESISASNSQIIYRLDDTGDYLFKFIIDSYFIKDTTINVNKSKSIDINLSKIDKGSRELLSKLIFNQSSVELTENSKPYLNELLHIFKEDKNLNVIIEGHTDNTGDFRMNLKLSKERANVIKKFLVDNGINKNQITVKGLGPTKPRFSNSSEETRKKNRRVEIYIN